MSIQKHLSNQTEFNETTSGIYSTGSGDVNLFVSNLGEAIKIIKQLAPSETRPIEQLINALQQLTHYQKVVHELKKVHNMLHRLETFLSMLEATIQMQRRTPNLQAIESNWRIAVRPQIRDIEHFAANEMEFLKEPRYTITDNRIVGPFWVVDLITLQKDFEAGIKEQDYKAIYELSRNLLDVCRDHLFRVDRQLLESITALDQFSDQILGIINNG